MFYFLNWVDSIWLLVIPFFKSYRGFSAVFDIPYKEIWRNLSSRGMIKAADNTCPLLNRMSATEGWRLRLSEVPRELGAGTSPSQASSPSWQRRQADLNEGLGKLGSGLSSHEINLITWREVKNQPSLPRAVWTAPHLTCEWKKNHSRFMSQLKEPWLPKYKLVEY